MSASREEILSCLRRLAPSNEFHGRVAYENERPDGYKAAKVSGAIRDLGAYVASQVPLDTRTSTNQELETTVHIASMFAFNEEQLVSLLAKVLDELGTTG